MSTPLLSDELWDEIAPLLPLLPPQPKGGRPRVLTACVTQRGHV